MPRHRVSPPASPMADDDGWRAGRKKTARRLWRRAASLWQSAELTNSAIDLEQSRAALAAADAHGDDAPLGLAATSLLQDVAGQSRAGHAEGVADRDRAAVDVVLLGIDAELVAGIETLAGKGLVELPDVDIVDLQAVALQQFRHGVDRAEAHLVRLAAGGGPGDEAAKRIEPALLGVLGFHQHDGGGAVRQLA